MNRWIAPLIVAALLAVGSYIATMAMTPYVLMKIAENRIAARSPVNRFTHSPPVRADAQFVVRPSPDLLYSICPFDLTNGPLEVRAEPVPGRYSSISVFDARTDVAFVRNDEQMAGQPMRVVLAMRGQAVPQGVETVRLIYPTGIILQRVLLADPSEAAEVDLIRSRASCAPLASAE